MVVIRRPDPGEYAAYYHRYIELVPGDDLIATLEAQTPGVLAWLRGISEAEAAHRYAPGKWSVKEVVGHVADTERIMAYRALRFARGDRTPLASFDENACVAHAGFDARDVPGLVDEFETARHATLALLRGLSEEAVGRRGTASGWEVSVRALAYIIAGHERHHVNVLRERYGLAGGPEPT